MRVRTGIVVPSRISPAAWPIVGSVEVERLRGVRRGKLLRRLLVALLVAVVVVAWLLERR